MSEAQRKLQVVERIFAGLQPLVDRLVAAVYPARQTLRRTRRMNCGISSGPSASRTLAVILKPKFSMLCGSSGEHHQILPRPVQWYVMFWHDPKHAPNLQRETWAVLARPRSNNAKSVNAFASQRNGKNAATVCSNAWRVAPQIWWKLVATWRWERCTGATLKPGPFGRCRFCSLPGPLCISLSVHLIIVNHQLLKSVVPSLLHMFNPETSLGPSCAHQGDKHHGYRIPAEQV